MNIIWSILMCFCLIYSIVSGRVNAVIDSFFDAGDTALKICISVSCLIVFFNGVFNVAIESGLIKKISFLFRKISSCLFKDIKNQETIDLISLIISANFLGLSVATTPMVFKVLDKMKKEIENKQILKKNICLLAVLNISGFTLFPLTILSIREKYGSNFGIIVWLVIVIITFVESVISLFLIRKMNYELFD